MISHVRRLTITRCARSSAAARRTLEDAAQAGTMRRPDVIVAGSVRR